MKTLISCLAVALICSATAWAGSRALDPRVPGLQRQVNALKARVAGVEQSKLDKNCIDIIQTVIRPGYVYQRADGSLVIYQAMDSYVPGLDGTPNWLMQLAAACR